MLLAVFVTTPLVAQGRLVGARISTIGPVYEMWRFGNGGVEQPTPDGATVVRVTEASQWSLPIAVAVPIGERWLADLTGAYASGVVTLAPQTSATGPSEYTLNGVTDLRLRVSGRLAGNATSGGLLLTLAVTAPTGKTELNPNEVGALQVLASPALGFQVPTLGAGAGATAGLVGARQLGAWSLALGLSYELRRLYEPGAATAGVPLPELDPSDALHISMGVDGLVGGHHAMTVALSTDLFTEDHLRAPATSGSTSASVGTTEVATRLGPMVTLDWQLQIAPPAAFRELTLYAVDRYRGAYSRSGETVAGSSGNYLDLGARGVLRAGSKTGVLLWLSGRHQTGLDSDRTLTTAAVRSAAFTVGLVRQLGAGLTAQPFARVQGGTIESGAERSGLSGYAVGFSLTKSW